MFSRFLGTNTTPVVVVETTPVKESKKELKIPKAVHSPPPPPDYIPSDAKAVGEIARLRAELKRVKDSIHNTTAAKLVLAVDKRIDAENQIILINEKLIESKKEVKETIEKYKKIVIENVKTKESENDVESNITNIVNNLTSDQEKLKGYHEIEKKLLNERISVLTLECEKKDEYIATIKNDMNTLVIEKANNASNFIPIYENYKEAIENELSIVKSNLVNSITESKDIKDSLEKYIDRITELESLSRNLQISTDEAIRQEADITTKNKELQATFDTFETENQNLKNKMIEVNEKSSTIFQQNENNINEINSLKNKLDAALRNAISAQCDKESSDDKNKLIIKQLEGKNSTMHEDIGKLVLEKQIANNELASLSKNLIDIKKQLETTTSEKVSSDSSLQALSKQLDSIKTSMQVDITKLSSEKQSLANELALITNNSKKEFSDNKDLINTLNANMLDLQNNFDLLKKENENLKIELQNLKSSDSNFEKEMELKNNQLTHLEEKIINLNNQIESITKEKDDSIALSNESKTNLEKAVKDSDRLESHFRVERKNFLNNIDELNEKITKLEENIKNTSQPEVVVVQVESPIVESPVAESPVVSPVVTEQTTANNSQQNSGGKKKKKGR